MFTEKPGFQSLLLTRFLSFRSTFWLLLRHAHTSLLWLIRKRSPLRPISISGLQPCDRSVTLVYILRARIVLGVRAPRMLCVESLRELSSCDG